MSFNLVPLASVQVEQTVGFWTPDITDRTSVNYDKPQLVGVVDAISANVIYLRDAVLSDGIDAYGWREPIVDGHAVISKYGYNLTDGHGYARPVALYTPEPRRRLWANYTDFCNRFALDVKDVALRKGITEAILAGPNSAEQIPRDTASWAKKDDSFYNYLADAFEAGAEVNLME